MNRRNFLTLSAATLYAGQGTASRLPIKKGVQLEMLPEKLSYRERFQLARDTGFDEIECVRRMDQREVEEIRQASEDTRVRIHSVLNRSWQHPLSSSDPAIVAEGLKGMEVSLRNAHRYGADTVLLVPAVVTPDTTYGDAWERSQRQILKLVPLAQELKVVIAVENVWNKFLLSPLEFVRYVDGFHSPWVKAYFDVANVVLNGYPQDWIRTLGARIAKLHFKDFRFDNLQARWTPLREGAVDWLAVHRALRDVGYHGTATVELPGGDEAYLREVSRRVDLILNGTA
jgi:hexulose-6-phosphate isomerase